MRLSELQQDFRFWVNYPFNVCVNSTKCGLLCLCLNVYCVCCWCTAISIVALSITVLPTAALISTGLLAKTGCTSLLQWQTSPLRQARRGHPPYRSGSAQTSAFPGCLSRAVLVPHWGSQPHCRTRENHLDSQAKKWSTRPKPSGTSSSLSLCLHFNVSLGKS